MLPEEYVPIKTMAKMVCGSSASIGILPFAYRGAVRGRGDKVERKTEAEGRGRKWGKGAQRVE